MGRPSRCGGSSAVRLLECGVLLLALALTAGCQEQWPPRTYADTPLRGPDGLEVVAALGAVVGNIAVSPTGRIFITYHPAASPQVKVAEIFKGNIGRPYPDEAWQERFPTPQGIKLG